MVVGAPDEVTAVVRQRCGTRAVVVEREPATAPHCERSLDLDAPSVLVLGDFFGTDPPGLIRRFKSAPHRAFLPVLALVDSEVQRRSMWAAGADHAVALPAATDDVAAAIDGLLGRCEQIERQLGVDLATGLLAREAFCDRLDEGIRFVRRYHIPGCAGVLSLAAPGLAAPGLAAPSGGVPYTLRWTAAIARASLREVDALGIVGPDAIGAVMLGTTLGGGIVAMRRLLEHVQSASVEALEGVVAPNGTTAAVTSFGNVGVEKLMERFHRSLERAREREPGTLVIL